MNISLQESVQQNLQTLLQEVRVQTEGSDVRGQDVLYEIRNTLGIRTITDVRTIKVYRLQGVDTSTADILAQKLLCDSVYQTYTINQPIHCGALKKIEVAYKPGVANPEVDSLCRAAEYLNIVLQAADTSFEYHFFGELTDNELQKITEQLLVNKTVGRLITEVPQTLLTEGTTGPVTTIPLREMSETQLVELSKKQQLFLNSDEMKVIQKYFQEQGRDPRDAELETLAQTWSEHCNHKTFKANLIVDGNKKEPLYARLKKVAHQYCDNVVSAFIDNAGAYRFYDGYAILGKVETHNSPSAIEPYGGAGTGSSGVFRDIMGTGQGAKVIASTDMFCFAPPTLDEAALPPGCLHPNYLLRNVVYGVRDYGNRMGIPTNNGSVHFHENFKAKPTVIVGAYGITPEDKCKKGEPQKGDIIFSVGGKVGRDGIHGATFSSGEMTAKTQSVNASAVQIGNPIEQKRMADALLECRDQNLIRAITDCGAGGFSSAIGEMAEKTGAYVDLQKVPLKYAGLAPWEIWISESQERMVCAVAPNNVEKFKEACAAYNALAVEIGHFTDDKQLTVVYDNQIVCDLFMDFLHNGLPQRTMIATQEKRTNKQIDVPFPNDLETTYCKVMSHLNICSKEPIVRQYDHGVQGTNVLSPFSGIHHNGPNDAVVLQPLFNKPYGVIIAHGMNPELNMSDPYKGSIWAITEALANVVAVGGNPQEVGLIDNFIWPFPDEHSLWDLDQAIEACIDAMHAFKIPFISGKDSLSSTYRYPNGEVLKIPPVLCISAFGRIPDIKKTISADFKRNDSVIVLLGLLDKNAMGGSAYLDIHGIKQGIVPTINLEETSYVFNALHELIQQGEILACHDISEGGLAVALAEMCFGGDVGAEIDVTQVHKERSDYALFNETAGCFLVEVTQKILDENIFVNMPHVVLGHTTPEKTISVIHDHQQVCFIETQQLLNSWQQPLKKVFHS